MNYVFSQHLETIPHGHELRVLIDRGFDRLYNNPKDGIVSLNEYDATIITDDADSK